MDKKEIQELIEEEKKQLQMFLELAKKMNFPSEGIEKQTNFYLDRIIELKKQLKHGKPKS